MPLSPDNSDSNIVTKLQLYESFQRLLDNTSTESSDTDAQAAEKEKRNDSGSDSYSDAPYWSVYWSPSGGTTGAARHVPVDADENALQRSALAPILLAGGVFGPRTINANLFDTGRGGFLYRALEIFNDFVTQCGGTSLPLGWHCPDDAVVARCAEFRANSISGSPTRLASLAGFVMAELRRLEPSPSPHEDGGGSGGGRSPSRELDVLNAFRRRVTRGVFACEPMHDGRFSLIKSAFPNIELASVLGGAEVGCWGVSLPCMANNAFLFDRRVVDVRIVPVDSVEQQPDLCSEGAEASVGRLIVTNHLRERFPVRNFDTGDLGSVVLASSVCLNMAVLAAVEVAVRDGKQMKGWSDSHELASFAQRGQDQLVLGVIFSSRTSLTGTHGQFSAYTHTLNASELVERAAGFARAANAAEKDDVNHSSSLGPFVNGQVVIWFEDEDDLRERIDVRIYFAYVPKEESNEREEGSTEGLVCKGLSVSATTSMRNWIMSTVSKDALARAIAVTVSSGLGHDVSDTASNQNKIPLLRDLRGDSISGRDEGQGPTKPDDGSEFGDCLHQTPPPPTIATAEGRRNFQAPISSDGLDSHSVWIGAYQGTPAPLWALPASAARFAHADLERQLRRVVPPRLLERVPPATWAPYPFVLSLPLYDAMIALCSNLRRAVRALLSPRGLALLRGYYADGGVAGGLLDVPPEVAPLLFGEADTASFTLERPPMPVPERVASDASNVSRVSSIDLGWSRTLLMERERERSDGSKASASTRANVEDTLLRAVEEEGEEGGIDEEPDETGGLSHLGIPEGDFAAGDSRWDAEYNAGRMDTLASALSRDLVFWRPDFLFDLSKVRRCEECSHAGDCDDFESGTAPWPPTLADTSRRMGRLRRSSSAPPVSICEINARFTMNAFALSAFGVDAASRMLQKRPQSDKEAEGDDDLFSTLWTGLDVAPVHRLVAMKEEIRKRIVSPRDCPAWLVKGRERGYDCHAMEDLLGVSPVRDVAPSDLPALLDEWFLGVEPTGLPTAAARWCSCPDCPNHKAGALVDAFECESACPSHRGGTSCNLLIFLELHQDEIVSLPASTLRFLTGSVPAVRNCCCRSPVRVVTCNPLSALFLLHDKRTLAVMGDQKAMKGLVGTHTARVLAESIVCTVPVSDSVRAAAWTAYSVVRSAVREELSKEVGDTNPFESKAQLPSSLGVPPEYMSDTLSKAVGDPSGFVLKRSRSGKGAGMIYGQEVSRQTWLAALFRSKSGSYVLQPKVKQATFPCVLSAFSSGEGDDLTANNGIDDSDENETCIPRVCHIVGCLPFLGDATFGPGIFRASPAGPRPVSVTGGGGILLPTLCMADVTFTQLAPRWLIRSAQSFSALSATQRNEPEALAKLQRRAATWSSCGDCALRNTVENIGKLTVEKVRDDCNALLFYSGVSVLACRQPKILSQQLCNEWSISTGENLWIMVFVPPSVRQLGGVKELLLRHGVCVWTGGGDGLVDKGVAVDDPSDVNKSLLQFVAKLNGVPKSHFTSHSHTESSDGDEFVWDITPCCRTPARSHNDQAFPMHTDASFEQEPPSHFLLYVLSQDVLGGGLSRILSGDTLLRVLSPKMHSILSRPTFTFQVPFEFRGEDDSGRASVVTQSILMTPSCRWRFRADIVRGPDTPYAVRHLDDLLRTPSLSVRMRLIPGSVLLVDNGLFFHARSEILDSARWLKRVRFCMTNMNSNDA